MMSESEEKQSEEDYPGSVWMYVPDPVIFHIFRNLSPQDLILAAGVCSLWRRIAYDELLWKELFIRDFCIDPKLDLPPGQNSWFNEYIQLWQHTPVIETEYLKGHTHQVLHVSFSHNGKLFATCSKDGYILVWDAGYPSRIKFYHDMKTFSWKYTQYSQFNESDTLLLVSGVHFGSHSNTGEIAVFSVRNEFELQCRVVNKPYDFFGSWYNDQYLLSGELQWLAHLVSRSTIWLNKASQEAESEFTSVMNRMFKFYNRSASSVRSVMVANCVGPVTEKRGDPGLDGASSKDQAIRQDYEGSGNPVSHRELKRPSGPSGWDEREESLVRSFGSGPSGYNPDYRDGRTPTEAGTLESSESDEEDSGTSEEEGARGSSAERESDDDLEWLDSREKYLIFTMSTKTYTPHQVGIKRVAPFAFSRRIARGPSLAERRQQMREREGEAANEALLEPDWSNQESVAHFFDPVDHIIDLHGHIIGMALSPDHKFLYVNVRPWPRGYLIDNPLLPPPIAQEIDIHVIDMLTMKEVGAMHRSHKAFTPNEECFFIFLNVGKELVASGAEDRHGWVWHRYWGVPLVRLPHADVVNSVAFHPKDPEVLITASDDYTLKVWRSRNKARKLHELGVPKDQFLPGTEFRGLDKKGRRQSSKLP